jgi:hypothetical protein
MANTARGAFDGSGVEDGSLPFPDYFQLAQPLQVCNSRRISSYSSRCTLVLMSWRASSNTSGK